LLPKLSQTLETKHHTSPIINRMLKLQGNTGQKWSFSNSLQELENFAD